MKECHLVKKGEKSGLLIKTKKSVVKRRFVKDFGLGPAILPFMGSGFLFCSEGAEHLTEIIF